MWFLLIRTCVALTCSAPELVGQFLTEDDCYAYLQEIALEEGVATVCVRLEPIEVSSCDS